MPTVSLHDSSGAKIGELALSGVLYEAERSIPLMHQAVVVEESRQRLGTHSTKGRSEVRGGGKKPWRQKGTGRARQGTIRAPHFTGGGVVFGPVPRDHSMRISKKMRHAAMRSALSAKLADGEVLVVDGITLEEISTKRMAEILQNLEVAGSKVLLLMDSMNDTLALSTRNIPYLTVRQAPNVSVRDVIDCDRIVATKGALDKMEEVYSQ